MFIPQQDPCLYQHQYKMIDSTFSLLCWNIHKENLHQSFHTKLDSLLLEYSSDFLLFQEYKLPKHKPHQLKDFSYAMAANIETKRHIYGLLTASYFGFDAKQIERTHQRELLITTRKSMLLTSHSFCDGDVLHMVNMHGINFVSFKSFDKELKKIESILKTYCGAMIVCGDFNNWSKKRMKALESFKEVLFLQKALIQEEDHVKHIFSKPIDHIFYRGLRLIRAEAINTKKVSDHNPLYAVFQKI